MMRKELSKIEKVSNQQLEFGHAIGVNLNDCTIGVAVAKIEDQIDRLFWSKTNLGQPTVKQIALAKKFGFDISNETRRVGFAVINDILKQLDIESIESQQLSSGDIVIVKDGKIGFEYIISSIRSDGIIFFKGGNGRKAYARNVLKKK